MAWLLASFTMMASKPVPALAASRSPFMTPTSKTRRGKKIVIELERKRPYELDGGARPRADRLEVRVEARAITRCVPASAT